MGRKPRSEKIILEAIGMDQLTFTEIMKRTGLPRATVSHALKRLEKKGLLKGEVVDGKIKWSLTTEAKALLSGVSFQKQTESLLRKMVFKVMDKDLEEWTDDDWLQLYKIVSEIEGMRERMLSLQEKIEKSRGQLLETWRKIKRETSFLTAINFVSSLLLLESYPEKTIREKLFASFVRPSTEKTSQVFVREFLKLIKELVGDPS